MQTSLAGFPEKRIPRLTSEFGWVCWALGHSLAGRLWGREAGSRSRPSRSRPTAVHSWQRPPPVPEQCGVDELPSCRAASAEWRRRACVTPTSIRWGGSLQPVQFLGGDWTMNSSQRCKSWRNGGLRPEGGSGQHTTDSTTITVCPSGATDSYDLQPVEKACVRPYWEYMLIFIRCFRSKTCLWAHHIFAFQDPRGPGLQVENAVPPF